MVFVFCALAFSRCKPVLGSVAKYRVLRSARRAKKFLKPGNADARNTRKIVFASETGLISV